MIEIERPYGKMRVTGESHPEFVDFKCETCGAVTADVYFKSKDTVTSTVDCTCGNKAGRVILRTNFIHPSHSSLYGRKEPAFGNEVVEDYGHLKRLMRKYDVTESNDPVGGNRKHSEEVKHQAYLNDKRRASQPASSWHNDPNEIE